MQSLTGREFESHISHSFLYVHVGTFKSQPLCNSQTGKRFVPASSVAIFTPRWSLEKLVGNDWPEWIRFTRSLYRPILADRQLLFHIETTAVDKTIPAMCERVPTASLRRTLLLLTPSLIEERLRINVPAVHEQRLMAQFRVPALGPMLYEWLAVTLSSFERTLAHMRAWLRDEQKAQ